VTSRVCVTRFDSLFAGFPLFLLPDQALGHSPHRCGSLSAAKKPCKPFLHGFLAAGWGNSRAPPVAFRDRAGDFTFKMIDCRPKCCQDEWILGTEFWLIILSIIISDCYKKNFILARDMLFERACFSDSA
jgi:hypothetical protein